MEHSQGEKHIKEGGIKKTMEEEEGRNYLRDRITELPEVILHKILAFLDAKDAARTTTLSKRWGSVWASFPILDFNETFWSSRKDFIDYVDNTMQQRSQVNIQKFKLYMNDLRRGDYEISSSCIESWIKSATKGNLEELTLKMSVEAIPQINQHMFSKECKFCLSLPQNIFTTESLTVLKLRRCKLEPSNEVKLPHLKTLSLEEIHAENGIIQDLLSSCLLVETLIIKHCSGLEHFYCSNSQLQTLIVDQLAQILNKFDIDTPNLQSFSLALNGHGLFDKSFQINAARLKSLSLQGLEIRDAIFQGLISKFPLLENLKMVYCSLSKKLKFYKKSLTSLVLFKCWNLVEVGIDAPKLISFKYTGQILKVSLMNTSCKLHVELGFESDQLYLAPIIVDSRKFSELKEMLGWFGHAQILTICCSAHKMGMFIIPEELRETSVPPLLDLKHLELKITYLEPPMNDEELIDSLLWIAPNIETLSIDTGSTCKTLKFQSKDPLGDWEE